MELYVGWDKGAIVVEECDQHVCYHYWWLFPSI